MKRLSIVLIAIIFCVQTAMAADTGAITFTDVPHEHVNYVAINYLFGQGIIKGYDDNTFKPDNLVNRSEALKILLTGNKTAIPAASTVTGFSDVKAADWFAPYIEAAKKAGIVGGNPDGTFAPGRNVARADYLKMILTMNGFKPEMWVGKKIFNDVGVDDWFAPYMNYAGQSGLITADANNNLYPSRELTRGEVVEIYYLLTTIRKGGDTQFLLTQSEAEMAQIEIFIGAKNPVAAKRASELAVDMTQQAYKNMPDNNVVLGAAKLAKSYDFLMNSYITAIQKQSDQATEWANQAITKATEAWNADNALQEIARHVKDRANEILAQIKAA